MTYSCMGRVHKDDRGQLTHRLSKLVQYASGETLLVRTDPMFVSLLTTGILMQFPMFSHVDMQSIMIVKQSLGLIPNTFCGITLSIFSLLVIAVLRHRIPLLNTYYFQ